MANEQKRAQLLEKEKVAAFIIGDGTVGWRGLTFTADDIEAVRTLDRARQAIRAMIDLTPRQAETLALSRQLGTLYLAKRDLVKARAAFIVAPAGEPRIELLEYTAPKGGSSAQNSRANTLSFTCSAWPEPCRSRRT